mmetsp:Transcript_8329/g.20055  ORF Transcript_8329/g.20055 Transcript_8329/m.20055 type:complete len:164 (+) Transcript_8329:44-535(+)
MSNYHESNSMLDSDNDSFIWEDNLEDEDMISEEGEGDFGISCNDLNWDDYDDDEGSLMSVFSVIRFDFQLKDDVSALDDLPTDERSTDSTILSVQDWFSIDDTEVEVKLEQPPTKKQPYSPDTIEEAIRLEKREKRRSVVMAKMLRLEVSMQKLGVQLGKTNE